MDPESAYDQHWELCGHGNTIPVEIGTVDLPQLAFFSGGGPSDGGQWLSTSSESRSVSHFTCFLVGLWAGGEFRGLTELELPGQSEVNPILTGQSAVNPS